MANKDGNNGFLKNVFGSIKSAGKETAKSLMPNLSSAVSTNKESIQTAYSDTRTKFSEIDIKNNYLFKSGQNLIKNAMSDLKTGNLNNTQRQKENSDDPFAALLNFDLDSIDGDENNDIWVDESTEKSSEPNIFDLDADSKNDIKTIAQFSMVNTNITNRGMAMGTTQIKAINEFFNKNTLNFYKSVEDKLSSLENHLNIMGAYYKDVAENAKKQAIESTNGKTSLSDAYEMGTLDIGTYTSMIKKNIQEVTGVGSMITSMMIKPMITDFVNNPFGSVMKYGMKNLVPKGIRNSMGDIDKTIGMLPILLQGRSKAWQQKGGATDILGGILGKDKNKLKDGILGMLGKMLDFDKFKIKANKNAFNKGQIPFDGVTKRSITHVIPGYLRRILRVITGDKRDELVYDMDKGKFVRADEATKDQRDSIENSRREAIDNGMETLENKYLEELKKKKIIKNDEEANDYIEDLRKHMSSISKSGRTLASDLKASDLSDNKKTAKILMNIIQNMDSSSFAETNQALVDAYLAGEEKLKGLINTDLWSSVHDRGAYSISSVDKAKNTMDGIESIGDRVSGVVQGGLRRGQSRIRNDRLREGTNFLFEENEQGRNVALNNLNERLLNTFRGNINADYDNIKKKKNKGNKPSPAYLAYLEANKDDPRAKAILDKIKKGEDPSKFTAKITDMLRSGLGVANKGLYLFSTMSDEGLALRVKPVNGSEKDETETPKVNLKKESEEEKPNKVNLKKENKINLKKENKINLKKRDKGFTINENKKGQDSGFTIDETKKGNLLKDLIRDLTGSEKGIKGALSGLVNDKLESTKAGRMAKKYGSKYWNKFKETETYGKLNTTINGEDGKSGIKGKLKESTKGLRDAVSDRLKLKERKGNLSSKMKEISGFVGKKTGISKEKILGAGLSGLTLAGNTAGDLIGGLGKVIGGEMSIKDAGKSLWKGGKDLGGQVLNAAKGGITGIKNFVKDGGINGIKDILFRKDPMEKAGDNVEEASKKMTESLANLKEAISNTASKTSENIDNAVETTTNKAEETKNETKATNEKIKESNDKTEESIAKKVEEDQEISNTLDVVLDDDDNDSDSGKGTLSNLFKKGKGLLGKLFKSGKKGASSLGGLAGKGLGKLSGLIGGKGKALAAGLAAGGALFGGSKLLSGFKNNNGESEGTTGDGQLQNTLSPMIGGSGIGLGGPRIGNGMMIGGSGLGLGGLPLIGRLNKKQEDNNEEESEDTDNENENESEETNETDAETKAIKKLKEQQNVNVDAINKQPKINSDPKTSDKKKKKITTINEANAEKKKSKKKKEERKAKKDEKPKKRTPIGNNGIFGDKTKKKMSPVSNLLKFSPIGIINSMFNKKKSNKDDTTTGKVSNEDTSKKVTTNKEDTSGFSDPDPKVRTATSAVPFGIWKMSGAFALTYGNGGLFPLLMKGAKKAAGGGGISKMVEFFKKFWEVQTTGQTGDGTTGSAQATDYGGYNGKGIQALHAKTFTGDENGGDAGYISNYKGDSSDSNSASSSDKDASKDNSKDNKNKSKNGGGKGTDDIPLTTKNSTANVSNGQLETSGENAIYGIGLTMRQVIDFLNKKGKGDMYKNLSGKKVGSDEFNKEWKNIASSNGEQFKQDQIDYATETYYNPLKKELSDTIDFSKVGTAVESSLFSMALTGSKGSNLISGLKKDASDDDILDTIYSNKEKEIESSNMPSAQKKNMKNKFQSQKSTAKQVLEADKTRQSSGGTYSYNGNYKNNNLAPVNTGSSTSPINVDPNSTVGKIIAHGREICNRKTPYKLGWKNENTGIDCSGFVDACYMAAGINTLHGLCAHDQLHKGRQIQMAGSDNLDNAQPGDLLGGNGSQSKIGHVMLYIGNRRMMEASSYYGYVREGPVSDSAFRRKPMRIARILPDINADGDFVGSDPKRSDLATKTLDELAVARQKLNKKLNKGGKAKVSSSNTTYSSTYNSELKKANNVNSNNSSILTELNAINVYSVNNGYTIKETTRSNTKNNIIIKIKDYIDALSENTEEMNELLMGILAKAKQRKAIVKKEVR